MHTSKRFDIETGGAFMFAPYCERHGSRVLLPTEAITALIPSEKGIIARFECYCGAAGIWYPPVARV